MRSKDRLQMIGDWLNPLLVREVRQSLRGNYFAITIMGASLFCVVTMICGILWHSSGGRDSLKAGLPVFYFIFSFIWFAACVALPVSAANRFRSEKSSGEFELFSITAMSPRKVIFGKLQASFVLGLLLLSVAAPFMMVCYLLRGISAVDILFNIILLVVFSIVFVQIGILLGCLRLSKGFYSLIQTGFVVGLLYCSGTMIFLSIGNDFLSWGGLGIDRFYMLLLVLVFAVYIFFLIYFISVMMLELPNKNKAAPVKVFLLASLAVIPIFIYFFTDDLIGAKGSIIVSFYCFFLLPAVFSSISFPVPSAIAPLAVLEKWRNAGWKNIFKFILYPGRGSSFMWHSLFMLALSGWAFFYCANEPEIDWASPLIICAAVTFWSLVGNMLGFIFRKASFIALSLLGSSVPSIIALFFAFADNHKVALLLCPMTLPIGIDKANSWRFVLPASLCFWAILFIVGAFEFCNQRALEKKLMGGSASK